MSTKAYGRMVFWEGASLWVLGTRPGEGPYPKTKFHAHHAVQVTLSLRGWFTLENRNRQVGGDAAGGAPPPGHPPAGARTGRRSPPTRSTPWRAKAWSLTFTWIRRERRAASCSAPCSPARPSSRLPT